MLKAIRKRMSYANVTATLALFFAMSGGALAASHYLITSTKQIKPSVLTQLKGKPGTAGANGANGSPGAQGATGGQGPQGPQGNPGNPGTNGTNGESVAVAKASGSECKEGGAKFTAAGKSEHICNGEKGVLHPGEALPEEATETGSWVMSSSGTEIAPRGAPSAVRMCIPEAGGVEFTFASPPPCKEDYARTELVATGSSPRTAISFPIPLKEPLNGEHVVYVEEAGNGTTCPGTSEHPQAAAGYLCVYQAQAQGVQDTVEASNLAKVVIVSAGQKNPLEQGTGIAGAVLLFETHVAPNFQESTESSQGYGTWAVTEP